MRLKQQRKAEHERNKQDRIAEKERKDSVREQKEK